MGQKTIFELDLIEIAKWHRRCTIVAMASLVIWIGLVVFGGNLKGQPVGLDYAYGTIYVAMVLVSVVCVVRLQLACGGGVASVVIHGLLTLILWFLVLISVISGARTILRLAGAELKFFGAPADEIDKLRVGHCRGCGYSREGLELLQECPECRRVPQVI